MRKDTTTAKITRREIERNRKISKKRYIVEQYFGLSPLYHGAHRARFTSMIENIWDAMYRRMAFNLFGGSRLIIETYRGGVCPMLALRVRGEPTVPLLASELNQ